MRFHSHLRPFLAPNDLCCAVLCRQETAQSLTDVASATTDVTDDVTCDDVIDGGGTCAEPVGLGRRGGRRRVRLLPLLHTCRSCSMTFDSQLQLKHHADLAHRDVDAPPICWRVDRQQQQQHDDGHRS